MNNDFRFNDTKLREAFLLRRTTATTDYLKECMGTALLELMKEKPMEKISIEEMTAKADVGRSTYFRYFKSKEEVLAFKIVCLWKRFTEEHQTEHIVSSSPEETKLYFEFCLSIRPISDLLYATGHQHVILDAYLQIIVPVIEGADAKTYYLVQFLAYAVFGLMNAWILRDYKETPEEMAEIIRAWTTTSEEQK